MISSSTKNNSTTSSIVPICETSSLESHKTILVVKVMVIVELVLVVLVQ